MAVTNRDQLIAAIASGRTIQFQKSSITSVAGFYYTLFRTSGMPGIAGTVAGTTGSNSFDRTTTGALPILAPSNVSYCDTFEASGTSAGTLFVADRLVEYGGLSGNVTGAQSVTTVALPSRATGQTDVELWLEIYTATGTTASATVTATYTNQAGTTGRTATLIGGLPASAPVSRMYQFSLQAGDTGVQSVQSLTLGTATGTAGSLGLTLRRTLLTGSINLANIGFVQGWAETSLQIIPDSACLELYFLSTTTTTGTIQGALSIAQG